MQDAAAALQAAIAELTEAQRALPEDLARELELVMDQARAVLEAVRAKAPPAED